MEIMLGNLYDPRRSMNIILKLRREVEEISKGSDEENSLEVERRERYILICF